MWRGAKETGRETDQKDGENKKWNGSNKRHIHLFDQIQHNEISRTSDDLLANPQPSPQGNPNTTTITTFSEFKILKSFETTSVDAVTEVSSPNDKTIDVWGPSDGLLFMPYDGPKYVQGRPSGDSGI